MSGHIGTSKHTGKTAAQPGRRLGALDAGRYCEGRKTEHAVSATNKVRGDVASTRASLCSDISHASLKDSEDDVYSDS